MRSSVPVDNQGKTTTNAQVRRFDVKTFAFLDPDTGKASVEKVTISNFIYCTGHIYCKHPIFKMRTMQNVPSSPLWE